MILGPWFCNPHVQKRNLWRGEIMSRINQDAYSRVGCKPNLFDSQPMLLTITIAFQGRRESSIYGAPVV